MPPAGFRASQEQFLHAVTFLARPMAAPAGRAADPRTRLEILHSLVEERGEFDERRFHHNTFRQFLGTIGAEYEGYARGPPRSS